MGKKQAILTMVRNDQGERVRRASGSGLEEDVTMARPTA